MRGSAAFPRERSSVLEEASRPLRRALKARKCKEGGVFALLEDMTTGCGLRLDEAQSITFRAVLISW